MWGYWYGQQHECNKQITSSPFQDNFQIFNVFFFLLLKSRIWWGRYPGKGFRCVNTNETPTYILLHSLSLFTAHQMFLKPPLPWMVPSVSPSAVSVLGIRLGTPQWSGTNLSSHWGLFTDKFPSCSYLLPTYFSTYVSQPFH